MSSAATPTEIIQQLRGEVARLPEWLAAHVGRVAAEARRLAQRHELDVERVQAGAWGHDLFRAHSDAQLLDLAGDLGLDVLDCERAVPILLHGPVAAALAARDWGLADADVLEAMRWHTTAHAGMSAVALAVYVADKVEPAKLAADPGLLPARTLADHDLEAAALALLERRMLGHLGAGEMLHPASLAARNALLATLRARN